MWAEYGVTVILTLIILYAPGYSFFRLISFSITDAIVLAPCFSVVAYCVFGMVFGIIGVAVDARLLVGAIALSALAGLFVQSRFRFGGPCLKLIEGKQLLFFSVAGIIVSVIFYVMPLDGPESYVQLFDNGFHANLIQVFSDTSRYSIVQADVNPSGVMSAFTDFSFYPAAWHVICAFIVSILGVTVPLAQNAVNFAFLAFVFPLTTLFFISNLFEPGDKRVSYSAIFILAFAAFPWGFLVAGPLYSNFAGLGLLPAAMGLFKLMIDDNESRRPSIMASFLICTLAAVFAQPNVAFTAVVILTPLVISRILDGALLKGGRSWKPVLAGGAFLLLVLFILIFLYRLPFLSGVVKNGWVPYTASLFQGVVDFVDLGYRNAVAQLLLATIVLIGLIRLLHDPRNRWLTFGYLVFLLSYLNASSTSDGFFGSSFLSGFWYNDVDRIAANCVMVMIPAAAAGLDAIIEFVLRLTTALKYHLTRRVAYVFTTAVFVIVNFCPTFILAGRGVVPMSMGERKARLSELATNKKCLTQEEVAFLRQCKDIVGDALVLNFPFDGSAFAYMETGLNTVYRIFFADEDLELINGSINELTFNDGVRNKIDSIGAQYLLLLDCDDDEDSTLFDEFLNRDVWSGFLNGGIASHESEMDIVLKEGDMRLYRIGPTA